MKALTLLPKKIKEMYRISRDENGINVHSPSYINIPFDERFNVETNVVTSTIQNSKVSVALWKNTFLMHVTVFY